MRKPKKNTRKIALAVVIFFIAAIFVYKILPHSRENISGTSSADQPKSLFGSLAGSISGLFQNEKQPEDGINADSPEISGWIAWWMEAEGYKVVENHKDSLASVSPGWLKIDKEKKLVEIGKMDKLAAARKIKRSGIRIFPMLATDLSDKELADFIKDDEALAGFIENLIEKLKFYQADGLDMDFENIGAEYLGEFSLLTKTLGEELKKNGLKFSVVVQAQTGKNDWKGIKGQDLALISQYADEVRIMAYDKHGEFSDPGPITPMDWYTDIIDYNLKSVPKEKIVIGLPTYGYVWQKNGKFESFQFKDFVAFAKNKDFGINRDPASYELEYTNDKSTAWLSDSESVIKKIEYARNFGLDRFIIWNLGGTDEELFKYFSK